MNLPTKQLPRALLSGFNAAAPMPHDEQTERAVLASMISDERAFDVAADMLRKDDFYNLHHQALFAELLTMPPGLDLMIVRTTLKARGKTNIFGRDDFSQRLIELFDVIHTTLFIEKYCNEVLRLSKTRKAMTIAIRLQQAMVAGTDSLAIQTAINDLTQLTVADKSKSFLAALKQQGEDEISGKRYALEFPNAPLMCSTNCFLPGTITMLCASAGASKSFFCIEAIWMAVFQGVKATILMLESEGEMHLRRVLAQQAGNSQILNFKWVRDNPELWNEILAKHHADIEMVDNGMIQLPPTRATCDWLLKWLEIQIGAKMRMIVIDPITKMCITSREAKTDQDRFLEVAKDMLKGSESSLLLVTHPVKDFMKNPLIGMSSMAGSSDFDRFVDNGVWLENHPFHHAKFRDDKGIETQGAFNRTIHIMKARQGPGAWKRIGYEFSADTLRHVERGFL